MPAKTPEELHRLWGEYFNARDLDGLVALYEEEAAFMPQPGQLVHGRAAIREALNGFLALNAKFELRFQRAIEAEGVAILYSRWRLSMPDRNELTGQTSDVSRRQGEGTWLFLIDNPYGGAGVD